MAEIIIQIVIIFLDGALLVLDTHALHAIRRRIGVVRGRDHLDQRPRWRSRRLAEQLGEEMEPLEVLAWNGLGQPDGEDAAVQVVLRALPSILHEAVPEGEPQEVGPQMEFEFAVKHVELALVGLQVRQPDAHEHKVGVLRELEGRGQHAHLPHVLPFGDVTAVCVSFHGQQVCRFN